jgi:acyl-homoserine lactone acylase PvdQ
LSQNKTGQDFHVAGASIPSVPGVIVGRNEEIAWGVTTARLDLSDAYIEELTRDGDAGKYNGETVEIIEKEFKFDLSDGGLRRGPSSGFPITGRLSRKMRMSRGL